MSPEGASHAMTCYIKALKHQVAVAQSFFFGRVEEGMRGLMSLPEDVKLSIDQLLWEASGGLGFDPLDKQSQMAIASAIMHSLENRMGLFDE